MGTARRSRRRVKKVDASSVHGGGLILGGGRRRRSAHGQLASGANAGTRGRHASADAPWPAAAWPASAAAVLTADLRSCAAPPVAPAAAVDTCAHSWPAGPQAQRTAIEYSVRTS
eukprot:365659-Chlamydomonas_euryale.AAC.6